MDVQITKMEITDYEQIKENLTQDFDDFWSPISLRQELENKAKLDSYYIVAKHDEEIVGFAGAIKVIDEMNIMNIVVKKNKRNLGIGSKLLEEIIKISKTLNIKAITLEVNKENISAIRLYEKYGFKQVGLRKKYYNNTYDAILMSLY